MPIINKGWAYVSSSTAGGGTPGGSNTQIQYNNAGAFGGSSDLTWDGSQVATTNLSASSNISASSFYGDGSNLTGVTASAVNVADGPEQAIQFRVDTPVSGEISGSSALMFMTSSNTLSGAYAQFTALTASTIVGGSPLVLSASSTTVTGSLTVSGSFFQIGTGSLSGSSATFTTVSASNLVGNSPLMISSSLTTISGNVLICNGTASISNLSGCSPIQVLSPMQMQSGLSLSFNGATNTAKITNNGTNLDINSPGSIVLNSGNNNITSSANISASAFWANGVKLTPGGGGTPAGANTQIQFNDAGAFGASSAFKFDSSANFLTVQGSASVSSSVTEGQEILFGEGLNRSMGTLLMEDEGEVIDYLAIGHGSGSILLSSSVSVEVITGPEYGVELFGAPLTVYADIDGDTGSVSLNTDGGITASYGVFDASGLDPGMVISASNPSFGGGNVYAYLQFGSGSFGDGADITLSDFGSGKSFEIASNDGGLSLSGASGISANDAFTAQQGLTVEGGLTSLNQGLIVNNDSGTMSQGLVVNGTSTHNLTVAVTSAFNNNTTFNGSTQTFNGSATTFNAPAFFSGNVTLGDSSGGDRVTINANNIHAQRNAMTFIVHSGSKGRALPPDSGNGGLNFYVTTSAGPRDYLKFHTSGSAPGVVFGNNVYMNLVGNNELQPPEKLSFYVSSSVNGYVTRTTGQQVFSQAAGAGIAVSAGKISTITSVDTTLHNSDFAITSNKQLYLVRTGGGSYTASLPTLTSDDEIGQTYVVKDFEGDAGTNNIRVSGATGQRVDGGTIYSVTNDYGSVTVCAISSSASGFAWSVIAKT